MINPKELRIGNYIRYRDEWNCEVESLAYTFATHNKDLSEALYGLRCGSDAVEDYNGIPLTDEWLFKMGFKVNMTGSAYWNETEFLIGLDEEGKFFYGEWEYDSDNNPFVNHILDLNSVHQLQNLYFALVMEELNIAG